MLFLAPLVVPVEVLHISFPIAQLNTFQPDFTSRL
jgi:hypothetical protein